MKRGAWKKRIIEACNKAGTYRECFDLPITQLSEILEIRDNAKKQFKESGGYTVITQQTTSGPKEVKNPALTVIDEQDKKALAYWRDLGLTPSGLKKIDEESMKPKKKSILAEALSDL